MDDITSPLDRAIELCGGLAKFAAAIGQTSQTVSNWRARKIPAEHCPVIERATGGEVRCEQLRPDVQWGVLRQPAAQGVA
jgi:DNA-binding transcriptional regulator YdaS (Cro superfamily)